jgi:hypothetical protein
MTQLSSSSSMAVASQGSLKAVVFAWLLAGTLDISAAVIYYPLTSGVRVATLLQGIVSGVLGNKAFMGGLETAALGLALHYLIALIWTLIFLLAFRRSKGLRTHLFLVGMAYGVLVWIVMNTIVLPLSNVQQAPFSLPQAVVGAVILMFCIGLPIAMILGKYYAREPA